jgi:hypothetical protein
MALERFRKAEMADLPGKNERPRLDSNQRPAD